MHILYAAEDRIDAYLVRALREAGHVVEPTGQPADALAMAASGDYQAIVLDCLGAPVRAAARFAASAPWSLVVVIMPAADGKARAAVLKAGADACFTRPTPFIELEARLEALDRLVLRARPATKPGPAAVEMVAAEQAVRVNGQAVPLSGREFRVMAHMVARAGEVVDLEHLQQQVWGDAAEPRPDLVQALLSRLRRKLASAGAGARLRMVPGHGYVFELAAEPGRRRPALHKPAGA